MSHLAHFLLTGHSIFLKFALSRMKRMGLDPAMLGEIDHICYRVETEDRYLEAKAILAHLGVLASEEQVGGRNIATYHLLSPLKHESFCIPAIELPAPKLASFYHEGYEHCEFVVPDLGAFLAKYSHLPLERAGLDKDDNPTISLSLSEVSSVKFHPKPLLQVIQDRSLKTT
jgi:uncharacterized protein